MWYRWMEKSLPEVAKNVHEKCNNNEWLNIAGRNAHDLSEKYFDRDIAAKNLNNILIQFKMEQYWSFFT